MINSRLRNNCNSNRVSLIINVSSSIGCNCVDNVRFVGQHRDSVHVIARYFTNILACLRWPLASILVI